MKAKVLLLGYKENEINNFLNKFYSNTSVTEYSSFWKKEFENPIEISEFIAVFADNINSFNLNMWISLDKDVFIKVSPSNSNNIIKYLFERYPY